MAIALPADWVTASATEADLDDVMALEVQGFDPAFHEAREVYRQRLLTFPAGALVIRCRGRAVGCLFAEIWPETRTYAAEDFTLGHDIRQRHDEQGALLYVASMTLAPDRRGGGLGLALLETSLARIAAGHPALRATLLLVNEDWEPARRVYARAGFVEVARLPGFFRSAAAARDGLVLRRDF